MKYTSISCICFLITNTITLISKVDAMLRKNEVDFETQGRGNREHKNVVYDDGMTEAQFLKVFTQTH